jgi:zinc-ribbon domain
MMICERCGKDIPDNVAICPNCGTITLKAKDNPSPATSYGPHSKGYPGAPSGYADNIKRDYPAPPSQDIRSQRPNYSYGQPYNAPPIYQQATFNVTVLNTNNSTPLIVELLLTIFLGIFGVGWLIAGEVAVGVILLICSLFIYLPLLIISIFIAFFTFGLSLFCTGPMVIGAIVLNAILLNNRLKRKAASYMPIPPM